MSTIRPLTGTVGQTSTSVAGAAQPGLASVFPGFAPPRAQGVDAVTDYEARAAVHSIMANGTQDMANWFRQMLFNPNFGDRKDFLNSPERVSWFKNLAIKDLISGIRKYGAPVFTGDALRESIAKSYWLATGVDAFRGLLNVATKPFNLYPQTQQEYQGLLNAQAPDPTKPEGAQLISQRLGGAIPALIYLLWGHDASVNKTISNQTTPAFLRDGLTNPQSRDFGIIKGTPGGTQYVQGLLNNSRPGDQINQDFIAVIRNLFRF